jgi:murein DD-endopeptidase MepM/ murein hydrolase activator NlpD
MKRIIIGVFTSFLLFSCGNEKLENETNPEEIVEVPEVVPEVEEISKLYNIELDGYSIVSLYINKGEVLSEILYPNGISYSNIQKVVDLSKNVFSVRKLQAGRPYTLILKKDSTQTLDYMIYEVNDVDYVVYNFKDSVRVYMEHKPVSIVEKTASGIINSSLWNTMMDNGLDQELIFTLSDVYAWTIDFYHLQKGDSFKVIYTERQVEGKMVGIEQIIAAEFIHHGTALGAYLFESDGILDYFDDDGKSLRKAFLRAPVKFSRISSRYSRKRFHPVQKRYKSHLGTDYAASTGTPIMATGDGVVVASTYKKYNGNYVKIKHNATYTTQYLHMSKRAVKNGERVKQGQIIGYVGSTGLATGPHVCYRFWKNGKQVDPYRQKLPESKPILPDNMDAFNKVRAPYAKRIKEIPAESGKSTDDLASSS